jgi:hypothetical protein
MCLKLRCTLSWTVWPKIETGMITFRATRSSHSESPTSSRLNNNSAQYSCTCCLRHSVIVSKNDRGISSHGSFSGDQWSRKLRFHDGSRKN